MTALRTKTPAQLFALWVGIWLTLNGIAAFVGNPDFTAGTGSSELVGGASIANNGWHALFHLASGALGLACFRKPSHALAFTWALAATYLLTAAWGFVTASTAFWIIPVDTAGSILHAFEGILALAIGIATTQSRRPATA